MRYSDSAENYTLQVDQDVSYKEPYDRKGDLKMQSCFPCRCGAQIQIPHRSSGAQTPAFIGCAACGILYSFPKESFSHESLSHESLSHKSLSHKSLSHKSLSHESLSHKSLSHKSRRRKSRRRRSSRRNFVSRINAWYQLLLREFIQQDFLRRQFATRNENEPNREFVARESEASGNVLSGATTQNSNPEKSLLRKVIPYLEGCLASCASSSPEKSSLRKVIPYLEGCLASFAAYSSEKSFLQMVIPPVLGGLAALSIVIVTSWFVFGRGIEGTGPLSKDVPRITPQTDLADHFEISNTSLSRNKPAKFSSQRKTLPVPESIQSPEVIALGASESIKKLRRLQNAWSDVPADKKDTTMAAYYNTAKKLSKQLASLRGRSLLRWRAALEELASEIINDHNSKMVMQLGPIGKLPGINASSENDFVVTVLRIDESDQPDPSSLWALNEPWNLGEQQVSVQMLPGAWSANTEMEPTNCLVFGRLISIDSLNEESSTIERGKLTLQVHAAIAE